MSTYEQARDKAARKHDFKTLYRKASCTDFRAGSDFGRSYERERVKGLVDNIETLIRNWESNSECDCCGNNDAHLNELVEALKAYEEGE